MRALKFLQNYFMLNSPLLVVYWGSPQRHDKQSPKATPHVGKLMRAHLGKC